MTDLELEAQYFKDSLLLLEKDIAVRVESKNDIVFWDFVFKIARPSMRTEFYPQSSSGTKGKSGVMLLKEFADKELVLCVDSDYDYLLQNVDLQGAYIFQTYTYSIENYWSFAEGLTNMLEKATNTDLSRDYREGVSMLDFITFFSNYSEIIYDWLLYSLYSEKINDGQLSRKKCGENIGIDKNLHTNKALKDLKTRLKMSAQSLKSYQKQTDFKAFKSQLVTLGLNKNNAYLFVRGHDLFDRVTMPLVKSIGEKITKNKFESFKNAQDTEGSKNYADFLKSNTYEKHLMQNKAFQQHSLFQRIIADISSAIPV